MNKPTPLKLAIVRSGLSQKDIAADVGLDPAQLSRIVNGLHCDDATANHIADVLRRKGNFDGSTRDLFLAVSDRAVA
jgi:transcriptional regulator with XRE-family HTH domain